MASLFKFIQNKILGLIRGKETSTNEETKRNMSFTGTSFVNLNRFSLDEVNTWDCGDATKLLEFYTEANISTYPSEYIRTRNCRQYFWSQSVDVAKIKRTTANLVHNISTTLANIINAPDIYSSSDDYYELVNNILEENDFKEKLYTKQLRETLVEGWGAYRIDIDTISNEYPKIRYFRASNVFFAKEEEDIVGIIYLSNYSNEKNEKFMLVETRYVKTLDNVKYSCIDKECYKISGETYKKVPIKDCPMIRDTEEHIELANVPFILGEPCVFYEADGYENEGLYGKSIFYGKIDALDDYDQALSVATTCIRRSMPKTTYPVESLELSESGFAKLPNDFDTDYIAVPNQLTGDGLSMESNTPKVIQPTINLKIYKDMMEESLKVILGGIMSLNDIGLNGQTFFRDSAEAIRERSRQTLYTVNYVRKREQKILTSLLDKCIFLKELLWENKAPTMKDIKNYSVAVKYDKFLSPSKEQKIKSYLPMFQSGAISIEQFVRAVYEDEMSDKEMEEEIQRLRDIRLMANGFVKGQDTKGGENFREVPSFDKNSSPYQDEVEKLSDNSGMNNHNRALKNLQDL